MTLTRIVLPLLLLFTIPSFASAQQPLGHWVKTPLLSSSGPAWLYWPLDFAFSDSLHGILLCASSETVCLLTSDAGSTWDSVSGYDANIGMEIGASTPGTLTSWAIGEGCIDGTRNGFFVDSGVLSYRDHSFYPFVHYNTFAQFTPGTGAAYRFVLPSANIGIAMADSQSFLRSDDNWRTNQTYGLSLHVGIPATPTSAVMPDSATVWVATYDAHYKPLVAHTTDAGQHWLLAVPFDTTKCQKCSLDQTALGATSGEVYISVQSSTYKIAHTSDHGATWSTDSNLPGLIYRIAAVAPKTIWTITTGRLGEYLGYSMGDTLRYSSDDGQTWRIDSTTLAGLSVVEMHWYGANRGYIAAIGPDNQGVMLRWVPGPALAVSEEVKPPPTLTIYPNPASETLRIESASPRLTITDALGRTILALAANSEIDISRLPAGVYYVSDDGSTNGAPRRTRFVKE